MDDPSAIPITILKVVDAGHFLARETPSVEKKSEALEFQYMSQSMKEYYASDSIEFASHLDNIIGKTYLTKHPDNDNCHRALVLKKLESMAGTKILCRLVDTGKDVIVPRFWLKPIPDEFKKIKFQVQSYKLSGIVPISLLIDENCEPGNRPAIRWDSAANMYVNSLIEQYTNIKVLVEHHRDSNTYCRMYIGNKADQICLNDHLVDEGYAAYCEDNNVEQVYQNGVKNYRSPSQPTHTQGYPLLPSHTDTGVLPHGYPLSLTTQSRSTSSSSRASSISSQKSANDKAIIYQAIPSVTRSIEPAQDHRTPRALAQGQDHRAQRTLEGQHLRAQRTVEGQDFTALTGPLAQDLRVPRTKSQAQALAAPRTQVQDLTAPRTQGKFQDTGARSKRPDVKVKLCNAVNEPYDVKGDSIDKFLSDAKPMLPQSAPTPVPLTPGPSPLAAAPLTPDRSPAGSLKKSPDIYDILRRRSAGVSRGQGSTPVSSRPVDQPPVPGELSGCVGTPTAVNTPLPPPVKLTGRLPKCAKKQPPVKSSDQQASANGLNLSPNSKSGPDLLKPGSTREVALSQGVYAEGPTVPKPIQQVKDTQILQSLQKVLQDMTISRPLLVQNYLWPAIIRGSDVLGLSPAKTGKTLGYLVPVINQILQADMYTALPMGNGPTLLIICPYWEKANAVYDWCRMILEHEKKSRTLVIYGAGAESSLVCPLINGCEILIATPCCLLRMLEAKYTNLDKLCHIVFHDVDVLVEEFTDQVKQIMKIFATTLNANPGRALPRQVIATGQKWTKGLKSFMSTYMIEPLLIIASKLEAALLSNVKQIVTVCRDNVRLDSLKTILDCANHGKKAVAIVTTSDSEAIAVNQMLKCMCLPSLLLYGGVSEGRLEDTRRQWQMSLDFSDVKPLLVVTDDCLNLMNLMNADVVIHYDSVSAQQFERRLWTMSSNFHSDKQCFSYIIMTEKDPDKSLQLAEYLRRCESDIPDQLQALVDGVSEGTEERKKFEELCPYMKAYGSCRLGLSCPRRHRIFHVVDTPGTLAHYMDLPTSGLFKDAQCYYVRPLEIKSTARKSKYQLFQTDMTKLVTELAMWYCKPENRKEQGPANIGELAAVHKRNVFYRVQVLEHKRRDTYGRVVEIKVQYVDEGHIEAVETRELLHLPAQLKHYPYQAVEVFITCVKPVDHDLKWTTRAASVVHEKIYNRVMEGHILLTVGNTIWVDPLVERVKLEHLNLVTNETSVKKTLLTRGLAVDNPTHVELLMTACRGVLPTCSPPAVDSTESELVADIPQTDTCTETLSECGYTDVVITAVHTPALFYVQRHDRCAEVEELMTYINTDIHRSIKKKKQHYIVGQLVLAKFKPDNNRWYRGRILSTDEDNDDYEIFYLDFGDRDFVSFADLRFPWEEIQRLSYQAIECSFDTLTPRATEWTTQHGDVLWDLAHTDDDVRMALVAKVNSTKPSTYSGELCYNVEIFDTSTADVEFSDQLVLRGVALASEDRINEIFPEATGSVYDEEIFPDAIGSVYDETGYVSIRAACVELYMCIHPDQQYQLAEELMRTCKTAVGTFPGGEMDSAIRSLTQLLKFSYPSKTSCLILSALMCVGLTSIRNMDVLLSEGALSVIYSILNTSEDDYQIQSLISAVEDLAITNRSCCASAIRESGLVEYLCGRLVVKRSQNLKHVCSCLKKLSHDSKISTMVRRIGGIHSMCTLLLVCDDTLVLIDVFSCLNVLCTNNTRNQDAVRIEGGLKNICTLLEVRCYTEVLQPGIELLINICTKNDSNRQALLNLGAKEMVTRLLCSSFADSKMNVQSSLMQLLAVFEEKRVIGQPLPIKPADPVTDPSTEQGAENRNGVNNSASLVEFNDNSFYKSPKVLWSQTKSKVKLCVQLAPVKHSQLNITIRNIFYRAVFEGDNYELNLDIFADVKPDTYEHTMTSAEQLITVDKEIATVWPRLTQANEKLWYLSVDFDRWKEISSDSDEGDVRWSKMNVETGDSLGTAEGGGPTPRTAGVPPELADISSSSSSSEDEDEDRWHDVGSDNDSDEFKI